MYPDAFDLPAQQLDIEAHSRLIESGFEAIYWLDKNAFYLLRGIRFIHKYHFHYKLRLALINKLETSSTFRY